MLSTLISLLNDLNNLPYGNKLGKKHNRKKAFIKNKLAKKIILIIKMTLNYN